MKHLRRKMLELRNLLGLTQLEFARTIGITADDASAISRVNHREGGKTNWKAADIAQAAVGIRVAIAERRVELKAAEVWLDDIVTHIPSAEEKLLLRMMKVKDKERPKGKSGRPLGNNRRTIVQELLANYKP